MKTCLRSGSEQRSKGLARAPLKIKENTRIYADQHEYFEFEMRYRGSARRPYCAFENRTLWVIDMVWEHYAVTGSKTCESSKDI